MEDQTERPPALQRSFGIAVASLSADHRLHGNEALPSGIADKPSSQLAFTTEELTLLERRFDVHGHKHGLVQLMTRGVGQLKPVRSNTLPQLRVLKPVILSQSRRQRVNPMLVTAILFDEIHHSKPGKSLPFFAHSGLVQTLGPVT